MITKLSLILAIITLIVTALIVNVSTSPIVVICCAIAILAAAFNVCYQLYVDSNR